MTDTRTEATYRGYRLLDKIAEGGMGVIYRAEHAQIGREAAIKIIKREYCENTELVERFHREARAVNAIGHEGIVDIFDLGRDEAGRVFFIMELLAGESLAARLRRGPMRWSEGLAVLEQTGRALSAAHAAGFIHRDIKPENIFLLDREEVAVKLLDFGIAKLTGGIDSKLTKTGAVFGTPAYMSPEQINGVEVDPRSDIYSLGVVAYEMFAGQPPFDGETVGAIIKQHLFQAPPPLEPHPAIRAPADLPLVIERMLAKEVDDRYATMDEVLADLAEIAAQRPPSKALTRAGDRGAPPVKPEPAVAATPGRRRWPLYAGLLILLGGAAAAAVIAAGERGSDPAPVVAVDAGAEPAGDLDLEALRDRARSILRGSLSAPEPDTRSHGADALAAVGDDESVDPLVEVVEGDPDLGVRGHAAAALAVLGGASEREVLEAIYGDAPPALKVWFDHALFELGDREARSRLREAASSRELAVSLRAALALADISKSGDREAIAALTRLAAREAELVDVAPYAGILILAKLAALRHEPARKALLEALARADEAIRLAAAEGLARLGDEAASETLKTILDDKSSPNRLIAGRALVFLGDYIGFSVLTGALSDRDPERRRQAAEGLAQIGEKSSLEPLAGLLDDPDRRVQIAAAAALMMIAGLDPVLLAKSSIDWARSAIASQNWATRLAAARAIGDLPEDQAMPLLAAAVADDRAEVRKAAARSARRMRGARPARELARAVRDERDDQVAEEQIRALAALRQPASRDALASRAGDRDRVGVLAAGALIAVGDVAAISMLDRAMRAREAGLRLAAAEAAAIAGDPIVIPTLVLGTEDRVFSVKLAAAEGLSRYRAEKDRALPILEGSLGDNDASIAARAYAAMLRFGEVPSAGPSPAELYESADPAARLAAVVATAAMTWKQAAPILRRAVLDKAAEVRRRAIDALAEFGARHREAVMGVYRSLVRDRDTAIRMRARAQLARLQRTATAAKPKQPGVDLAALEKAHRAVLAASADLESADRALDAVVAAIEKATARPAQSDADVDRVEGLAAEIEKKAAAVIEVRARLQKAVAAGEIAPGAGDRAAELAAAIAEKGRAGAEIARAALAAGDAARQRASRYAAAETADPDVLVTAATTSIAAGKLSAARRDLDKAARLYRARGRTPPELDFARGQLYAALAGRAKDTDKKIDLLERAKRSYDRFARRGAGFRVGQARERSAEIATEIAGLLAR